jgi:hypothetical protein
MKIHRRPFLSVIFTTKQQTTQTITSVSRNHPAHEQVHPSQQKKQVFGTKSTTTEPGQELFAQDRNSGVYVIISGNILCIYFHICSSLIDQQMSASRRCISSTSLSLRRVYKHNFYCLLEHTEIFHLVSLFPLY